MNKNQDGKMNLAYIFPNLFTAASAFVGVIAIIAASNGQFGKAGIYILLSLVLDGLDGRVARLTNTTSKFGVEFDSLADIIAFGAAPAMLFYFSVGHQYGKAGSLIAAVFVVFGAIRLARFNVSTQTNELSVFIGVPIPTAAVFVTMWILMFNKYSILNDYGYILLILQALASLLMVSNIRYPCFKKLDFKKANMIKVLTILVIVFSMIYLYPLESIAFLVTSYILYGLIRYIYFYCKVQKK